MADEEKKDIDIQEFDESKITKSERVLERRTDYLLTQKIIYDGEPLLKKAAVMEFTEVDPANPFVPKAVRYVIVMTPPGRPPVQVQLDSCKDLQSVFDHGFEIGEAACEKVENRRKLAIPPGMQVPPGVDRG